MPDPYFGDGDGFRVVLAMVERTADALVASATDVSERPIWVTTWMSYYFLGRPTS